MEDIKGACKLSQNELYLSAMKSCTFIQEGRKEGKELEAPRLETVKHLQNNISFNKEETVSTIVNSDFPHPVPPDEEDTN